MNKKYDSDIQSWNKLIKPRNEEEFVKTKMHLTKIALEETLSGLWVQSRQLMNAKKWCRNYPLPTVGVALVSGYVVADGLGSLKSDLPKETTENKPHYFLQFVKFLFSFMTKFTGLFANLVFRVTSQ